MSETSMLDPYVRPLIDPPLNAMGKAIVALGVSAHTITLLGFVAGLAAMVSLTQHAYTLALVFFAFNRLLDGLDGAVARLRGVSDFGGFLDIVCDFTIVFF